MKTVISILMILLFFVIVAVGIIGVSEIKNEQAEVRNVWEKMLREMAVEGYLSDATAAHYTAYFEAQGYEQEETYFEVSHINSNNRAIRPQHGEIATSKNLVQLTIEVEPKPFIRAIKFLRDGQPNFIFSGTRISEYLPFEGGQP